MPLCHDELLRICWICGALYCAACHRTCPYCGQVKEPVINEMLARVANGRRQADRVLGKRGSEVLIGRVG